MAQRFACQKLRRKQICSEDAARMLEESNICQQWLLMKNESFKGKVVPMLQLSTTP
jgi:hypothetical protein